MNKLALIALFALIFTLGSAAPRKATPKYVDTKTVLAELDQDKFGNTFLSAIALNVASKSPLDDITLLIDQIMAQINDDQARADDKNRTDQAICDETIASFNQQIQEQKSTIASLQKAITDNTEILQQAKSDLAQAERDYDETVTAIQEGTAEREASHANWAEQDYQNAISIATLEEGVKLIQHMVHGVAFAQIKARYDKVLEKLANNNDKHTTLFKPLISSLTQLATKLNYENVMKILELLNNIRAAIVEEKEASREAEEKAQADWEVLLAHL